MANGPNAGRLFDRNSMLRLGSISRFLRLGWEKLQSNYLIKGFSPYHVI